MSRVTRSIEFVNSIDFNIVMYVLDFPYKMFRIEIFPKLELY